MFSQIVCVLPLMFYSPVQGVTTMPQKEYPEEAYDQLKFVFLYLVCMSKQPDYIEGIVECFEPHYILELDEGGGEYGALSNNTRKRFHDLRECLKGIHEGRKVRQKAAERKCFHAHHFNKLFLDALGEIFMKDEVRRFKLFQECLAKFPDPVADDDIKSCIKEDPIIYEMLELFALYNMKTDDDFGKLSFR